jgi:hypothetical protein
VNVVSFHLAFSIFPSLVPTISQPNISFLQPDFANRVRRWLEACRSQGLNPADLLWSEERSGAAVNCTKNLSDAKVDALVRFVFQIDRNYTFSRRISADSRCKVCAATGDYARLQISSSDTVST